jgi:UDP-glucose 4-epimerase
MSMVSMRVLVTGGAGFIGSNLAERLLAERCEVTVVDDLRGGSRENLAECFVNNRFNFVEQDLLDLEALREVMAGHDAVFHLAANSNIPEGRHQTDTDLKLGTLATYNVLEAMRQTGVRQIAFSSSSVVYGEPARIPTPENYGPLFPISLYGASKLACEGLISAYCHNYGFQAWIFRFANICGRHGTHGVMIDFIRKLQADSHSLEVLGDGKQSKPYLHVSECVEAMLYVWQHPRAEALNFFNLGCEGATSTDRIAQLLLETMGLENVPLIHSGGERGWPGDVPQVRLDCAKLRALGWSAKYSSDEAVKRATKELFEESRCRPSF